MAMVLCSAIPSAFSVPRPIHKRESISKHLIFPAGLVSRDISARQDRLQVVASAAATSPASSGSRKWGKEKEKEKEKEDVFFDGGPHYGDLLVNLVFGLTLIWLPLTLASVLRALNLRYRFTNLRVTIVSGWTGNDRRDFKYSAIKDIKYVPRFIGDYGDMVITLKDGSQIDLKYVPYFREIATYCMEQAGRPDKAKLLLEKERKGFMKFD